MLIRKAAPADAPVMAELLNEIISIGGTTAHQLAHSAEDIRRHYLEGPDFLSAVVAEADSAILGWQAVSWYEGEAHIGTFVRQGGQARGVGAAMFALTCRLCRERGLAKIMASIRADNVPGLAYYARIGFADVAQNPDFALNDGRVVGRVLRRFVLA